MAKRGSKTARKQTLWSKIKAKYSSFYKKRKKTTVLLSIVALLVVACGVRVSYEWTQFKIAERKVDKLHQTLVDELGKPQSNYFEGSCSYASSKFQKGDLGCSYGFSLEYKATDLNKANNIANKFDNIINHQSNFKISFRSQNSPVDFAKLYFNEAVIRYQQREGALRPNCTAQAERAGNEGYYVPRGINDRVIVTFSCDKSPLLRPIYPVKD